MSEKIEEKKSFKPSKLELETSRDTYILELDNMAIRRADEEGLLQRLKDMGIQEMAKELIYIFSLKNNPNITKNICKKIVDDIINENIDLTEICSILIDEISIAYESVFTSKGGKKSAIKRV